MQIEFRKIRSFGQKVNTAFAFFSENSRSILKAQLLVAGPFILALIISYSLLVTFIFNVVQVSASGSYGNNPPIGYFAMIGFSTIGILIFYTLVSSLITALIFRQLRHYAETGNTDIPIKVLYKTIWPEVLKALGTAIVVMFLCGTVGGFMMFPIGLLLGFFRHPVFIMVIMVVSIAVYAFIYGAGSLLFPVAHLEKVSISKALSRMFKLLKGQWLSTAGIVVVMFIIITTVSSVFMVPVMVLMFVEQMHVIDPVAFMEPESSTTLIYKILQLVFMGLYYVFSLLLTSLFFIALSFHYYDLSERFEAYGLMERINNFGSLSPALALEEDEQY